MRERVPPRGLPGHPRWRCDPIPPPHPAAGGLPPPIVPLPNGSNAGQAPDRGPPDPMDRCFPSVAPSVRVVPFHGCGGLPRVCGFTANTEPQRWDRWGCCHSEYLRREYDGVDTKVRDRPITHCVESPPPPLPRAAWPPKPVMAVEVMAYLMAPPNNITAFLLVEEFAGPPTPPSFLPADPRPRVRTPPPQRRPGRASLPRRPAEAGTPLVWQLSQTPHTINLLRHLALCSPPNSR